MSYRIDEGLQIRRQQEEAYQRALESQYRGMACMSGLLEGNGMGIQQALQAQHNSHISAAVPEKNPKKLLLLL